MTASTEVSRSHRRAAALLGCAAVLVAAAACSSKSGGGDSDVIQLGYTATMTGDFASYGLEMKEGVDLAVGEINSAGGIDGKKLKVTVADDGGKPANGPVVAQKFCDNSDVSAVFGYSFSSVALAAIPVYSQCKLPVIASAVTSPELSGASPYFFRTAFTDAYQGAQMGDYLSASAKLSKIAILYQQDDYGQGVAKAVKSQFTKAGGKVTSFQAYQLGTNDFGTLVSKAAADSPDAIFIGGFYTEVAKIAKQARASDLTLPLYAADGSLSPNLVEIGKDAVEDLTLYGAFTPSVKEGRAGEFTDAFTKKYDKDPTSWGALAYDAVYAMKDAMKLGGGTDRAAVAQGIPKIQALEGATGSITFDKSGDRKGSLVFLKVEDGKFVPVDK